MTITKIETQKNNEKRCSIYIDGSFVFGLNIEDLLYLKLKEDTEISQERYNYIMEYVIYSRAKDKAYRFLGYKARTEKELRDKLSSETYPEETINRVLELFKSYGYINDINYAQGHINNRIKFKPMAKQMLKYELIKKGVDADTIQSTIENSDIDELNMAISLLQKKIKNKIELDKKEKERAYNYLLRRGFNYEIVNKAFESVLNN